MRFVLSALEKDLRRHLRDPMALLLWVSFPLLIGGLVTLVMSGFDRAPPIAHLLVADEDGGQLSWLLAKAFGQAGPGQFLHVEEVQRENGRTRVGRGEASAMLVIPEGFRSAVLREKPTTLLLVTNPAQRILPRMIEEELAIAADGVFYLHRLTGNEFLTLAKGPPVGRRTFTNEEITRVSTAFNKTIGRLEKYLFPPVIRVDAAQDEQPGQKTSFAQIYLPGVMVMAMLFMASGLSGDIWRERELGTLKRAACTPAGLPAFLAGKLLASAVVMCACDLVILTAGIGILDLPLASLPIALAWTVSAGVLFLLLLLMVQLSASSQRAASVLVTSITMPLLFLGGSFFPFEVMPGWMAAVGPWTPNGWALVHLKNIVFDREDTVALATSFAILIVVGAGLFLLAVRRLHRVLAQS